MRSDRSPLFGALSLFCFLLGRAAVAAPNRLLFVNQSDWGFSGLAKWCGPIGKLPFLAVLEAGGTLKLTRHVESSDRSARAAFVVIPPSGMLPGRAASPTMT